MYITNYLKMYNQKNSKPNKKILPPKWLLICIILTLAMYFLMPVKKLLHAPFSYGGVILLAAGIWLSIWAEGLFKKHNTTVKPFEQSSSLVITGPFRFTRNPMYLGFILILAGVAILLGSASSFIGPVLFFVIADRIFIDSEETVLENTFGNEFLSYKKKVRRWI